MFPARSTNSWQTVDEIAVAYGISISSTRTLLKAEVNSLPQAEREKFYEKAGGPHPDRYEITFVSKVLKDKTKSNLNIFDRYIFLNHRKSPDIKIIGSESPSQGALFGILESRMKASNAYRELVFEIVKNGASLRIRCVSGTDFFNKHNPIIEAFRERAKHRSEPVKVLLLHPTGHGAEIRSAAEGELSAEASQLARDAHSTFGFLKVESQDLKIDPKWQEELPTSLLIWSEDIALVEPYDHGRQERDHSGCIGRKAPILIVRGGGTDYHEVLKMGFDYVFLRKEKDTHIKTWTVNEMERKVFRQSSVFTVKRPAKRKR